MKFRALRNLRKGELVVLERDVRPSTRLERATDWLRDWWPALVFVPCWLAVSFWIWRAFILWIVRP